MISNNTIERNTVLIRNKFGSFSIETSNQIYIPFGLIGIPSTKYYCVLHHNISKFQQFNLLQSMEESRIVFLTLPLEPKNTLISMLDITTASLMTGIEICDMDILLIASSNLQMGTKSITVNTRAPLFIDRKNRIGIQYVLQNNQCNIHHAI